MRPFASAVTMYEFEVAIFAKLIRFRESNSAYELMVNQFLSGTCADCLGP